MNQITAMTSQSANFRIQLTSSLHYFRDSNLNNAFLPFIPDSLQSLRCDKQLYAATENLKEFTSLFIMIIYLL